MGKILLVDSGDVRITPKTMQIVETVFQEFGFDTENVAYTHIDEIRPELRGFDLVIALGTEATKLLCHTTRTLEKYAGCLTWNEDLSAWVLPTHHVNRLFQERYDLFDVTYSHLRRSVDLMVGSLPFPDVHGPQVEWLFIGHNGVRQDDNLWTGYAEATEVEVADQNLMLSVWLDSLLEDERLFAADTESWNTDHFDPLTMIQIYDGERAFAFNWGVIKESLDLWREFFNHPNARFVWHNLKHDAKMILHWLDVAVDERHDDTMCWALGLTEKGNQTGLKYLSRQYAGAPYYEESLDEWLDKSAINYGHIRPDVLAKYGCLDVFFTYQLRMVLPTLVEREGTAELVREILLPAQRTLSELEYTGILVDQQYAQKLSALWTPKIESAIKAVQEYARVAGFPADPDKVSGQLIRSICDCVPEDLRRELESLSVATYRKTLREQHGFNPDCSLCGSRRYTREYDYTLNVHSWPHMHHLVFDMLGMEETWEGRKTNKLFWELNQSHEFAQLVLAYRELDYLHRNIVQGFSRFIRADGRVHPDFLLFGTTTGRLAVRNPAMQTVPSRSANAKYVKRLFLPDPGHVCVNVDYSNLELYMAHHLTGDPDLLSALQDDMHLTTAAAMYAKTCEEVTAVERQSAKPVNFGSGYNIKAKKLSRNPDLIGITKGEASVAQGFLDAFWAKYKVWAVVKEAWKREALTNCELTTELGRKRRWSLITSDNSWKVENQATNFKGQSMASDLCLMSLMTLQKELTARGWGRVMLTVHDSIVFSIDPAYLHDAVNLIECVMTTPQFETETPFKVDVSVGINYGDQESYDREKDYDPLPVAG